MKSEDETELVMVAKSDLNPFMKSVVERPMREAVDSIAEAMTQLPYDQI